MNPRLLLTSAFVLSLPLFAPSGASAANRPPMKAPAAKATPAQVHTTISSITADSITITDAKGGKTYKITKDTELELKGQKVTVEELKAGMRVSVTMGSDPSIASRVSASDAPKEAAAKDGADKTKKP